MQISIDHTREKLRQFGVRLRLRGNHHDRIKRVLLACNRAGICPVYTDQSGEPAY